ncbi:MULTISPECIES: hypothetical protein [unclassified Tenacibaculum]|uniref:hypothetical protein n=1 Tax=unclassified Tenacibaculum TaxID=2635139 RepID=UPI001F38E8AE|nr:MULTISPECIES: hypothetical protein [unclassified Tenacibaculum]MCF2874866.1 hypothetical protein [Tenacibaculum sp. Cn5-1]MCF2934068.1 hypothetical protein [Tenacibaculum sp. Cn5-34]MCG7510278.1 hypothetical protein [Tenacibaculum sp. Cn5-46]
MKKILFFIAVVIFASCNSNDETLKVNEQPREEFLTRSANEDYRDDQIGYFKSIDANSVVDGKIEKAVVITTWLTYGEYTELKNNPNYQFYVKEVKASTDENPILVSAKYIGAGGGTSGPFDPDDLDDDDNNDDDDNPYNPCWSARQMESNTFYSEYKGCLWSINRWRNHLQNVANATCEKISTRKICCKGVLYSSIVVFPPTPCFPIGVNEPGRETGSSVGWVPYNSETHN